MTNLKKSLFVVMLLILCSNNIFAQNEGGFTLKDSTQTENIDESNIVFSNNQNSNGNKADKELKTPSTAGLLIRMIIVLIIVIGIIYGVLWFIKRKTNVVKSEDEFLRRGAYINIAPGKSIEVITLIDKGYLIGVTEDNITLLGEIDDKELINAINVNSDKNQNVKKPLNFADVLDIFTAKGKKSTNVFSDTEKQIDQMYMKKEESK